MRNLGYKNKEKQRKYSREWYQRNRENHLKIVKEYRDRKRRERGCKKYDGNGQKIRKNTIENTIKSTAKNAGKI